MIFVIQTLERDAYNELCVFHRDENRIEADSWKDAESCLKQKQLSSSATVYGVLCGEIIITDDELLDIMLNKK